MTNWRISCGGVRWPDWRRGSLSRRRPISRAVLILVLGLLLSACVRQDLDQLAPGERGRVQAVRSGDTLVLEDGLVVRLAGIDAPNFGEPYDDEARQSLARLAEGADVELLYGGRRRDGYGRALAQVRLKAGRIWLQERLVKDGVARVRSYADNRALTEPLLHREAEARAAGRGLWGLEAFQVRLPVEARGRPGFQVIEGRVTGAFGAPQGAEMDLDQAVTVKIPERLLAEFARVRRDPGKLKGRLVRVRGYLRRDGTLSLDHPEQMEVLKEGA